MSSTKQFGLKITLAQREYYRYTGISAEMEKQGLGSSRAELAWARRQPKQKTEPQADSGKTSKE